jgi:hypothetical protein
MRGRCRRPSASTIRRSKPPTPPRRARPSGAAAMDGVLALRRHPSPARRRPGRALPGPGRRPRSGARRQQPARRCTPSSSRPWARSRARASSMSAPAPATIARSWPSWSTPPARSQPSSSTRRWPSGPRPFPAVRTFGSSVTTAPVAGNPGRPGSRQFCRGAAGRLLDRRPVSGRPARLPARCAWPPAAEFRRPAQRPRRGAQWRGDAYPARAVSTAYFACAEGEFEADPEEVERLRAAFEAGGLDTVRSLIWKRPAPSNHCWFAGEDWALSGDETP